MTTFWLKFSTFGTSTTLCGRISFDILLLARPFGELSLLIFKSKIRRARAMRRGKRKDGTRTRTPFITVGILNSWSKQVFLTRRYTFRPKGTSYRGLLHLITKLLRTKVPLSLFVIIFSIVPISVQCLPRQACCYSAHVFSLLSP